MDIWVVASLFAAAMQTSRFMLQKQLKSAGLSTGGATFSRFLFAFPLAGLVAGALIASSGAGFPVLSGRFFALAWLGGLCQIVGTFATVALFSQRNFAVGIAFTKSETLLVALFSVVIVGEQISGLGLLAIGLGVVGVILLSKPARHGAWRLWNKSSGLGLLAGTGFAISALGYRGATLEVASDNFILRAALTLAVVTTSQTLAMLLYLRLREPGEIGRVLGRWRKTALVGVTGMLGSLGWFVAFTLQNAAYVRALGQIELIFGLILATLVFGERSTRAELAAIVLLGLSIVMLIVVA